MPAQTLTTEAALKAYAHTLLGAMAASLGYTVDGGSYDDIVNEALTFYGVETVDEIEGIVQVACIRACTREALWKRVTDITNGKFNLSDQGTSLNLGDVNAHARKSYSTAKAEASELREQVAALAAIEAGQTPGIVIHDVTRSDDPYAEDEDSGDEFSE